MKCNARNRKLVVEREIAICCNRLIHYLPGGVLEMATETAGFCRQSLPSPQQLSPFIQGACFQFKPISLRLIVTKESTLEGHVQVRIDFEQNHRNQHAKRFEVQRRLSGCI